MAGANRRFIAFTELSPVQSTLTGHQYHVPTRKGAVSPHPRYSINWWPGLVSHMGGSWW